MKSKRYSPISLKAWEKSCREALNILKPGAEIKFNDRDKHGRSTVTCWAGTCPHDSLFGVFFVNGDAGNKILPNTGWHLSPE